ncbi:MAG: DUF262 domain-containing protein, partial [Planctomycetia bacterium]|nr:DUF262 domain-containing protein [Planctomycetia bacterium]
MSKLRFEQKSVRQLRDCLERRVFAIPRLQREFVWNGPKAAALLDSIYRGMPIGALTIWETGRESSDLLRPSLNILPTFDTTNKQIWYLLDGQQRLSVLHQSFAGESRTNSQHRQVDFSHLCFRVSEDVEGEEIPRFSYRKPIDGEFVSVPTLLGRYWKSRLNYLDLPPRVIPSVALVSSRIKLGLFAERSVAKRPSLNGLGCRGSIAQRA